MWVELAFLAAFLGVGAGAAGFTLAPLFRRRRGSFQPATFQNAAIRAEREAAVAGLAELDLDYHLGRVSEVDYAQFRERLHQQALVLLKQEEQQEQALDALIEGAIAVRRQHREVLARERGCPQCRQPVVSGTHYCSWCGAQLPGITFAGRSGSSTIGASDPAKETRREVREQARVLAPVRERQQALGLNLRSVRWLASGVALGAALIAVIVWLYFSSPSQAVQVPVGTVPPRDYQSLLVSPANLSLLFLGYDGGLLTSSDGGQSWQSLGLQGNIRALAAHPSEPLVLYAAGIGFLSRSDDGGMTWEAFPVANMPEAEIRALTVAGEAPGTIYFVGAGGELYATRDQGSTWETVSDRLPTSTVALVATPGQREPFYLATQDQGVLAGDGRSWSNANGFVNGALPTLRINALAFDAKSGDRYVMPNGEIIQGALYAGTEVGLFKSVDGAGSWNRLPFRAEVQVLALAPDTSGTIYVLDRRGRVFRSVDRGLTWTNTTLGPS